MDGRADSWKARDICEVISDNEYTETFELARPDKPFEVYSREERKQWLARLDSEALRARVGGSKRGQLSVYGVQGHHLPVPRGQLFRVRKMSENRTSWELQEIQVQFAGYPLRLGICTDYGRLQKTIVGATISAEWRTAMTQNPRELPYNLEGHVALITGGNHGIGAATARALADCGAGVLVSYLCLDDSADFPEPYRTNRSRNTDEMVGSIRARGGRAVSMEADLRDEAAPGRLFDFAEKELGPVDILINNATGWVADTFGDRRSHDTGIKMARVSASTHDQQFAVDARGGAIMIAEFAQRHMERRAQWGRIVGLTSGGQLGFPGEVSYGAAKAALENYTMAAAFELAPFGITANMVYPPVTDTGWVTAQVRASVKQRADLLHIVEPDDVAEVIVYLCTNFARLVTANVVHLR